jgi:hypothetical protein
MSERFGAANMTRELRAQRWARESALDALGGRTMRCVGTASRPVRALWESFLWAGGDGVAASRVARFADGEAPGRAGMCAGDIVVLHDAPAPSLADAIRDRGAHAIWRVSAPAPQRAGGAAAEQQPASPLDHAAGINAYLLEGRTAQGAHVVAAMMPSSGLVDIKVLDGDGYLGVGWGALLADIVRADREECVGGTLRPRPAVPSR